MTAEKIENQDGGPRPRRGKFRPPQHPPAAPSALSHREGNLFV